MKIVKVSAEEMKIIAEKVDEREYLEFIEELNHIGGFVPLMGAFAELINKDILINFNGEWVWNKKWVIHEDNPGYV